MNFGEFNFFWSGSRNGKAGKGPKAGKGHYGRCGGFRSPWARAAGPERAGHHAVACWQCASVYAVPSRSSQYAAPDQVFEGSSLWQ